MLTYEEFSINMDKLKSFMEKDLIDKFPTIDKKLYYKEFIENAEVFLQKFCKFCYPLNDNYFTILDRNRQLNKAEFYLECYERFSLK